MLPTPTCRPVNACLEPLLVHATSKKQINHARRAPLEFLLGPPNNLQHPGSPCLEKDPHPYPYTTQPCSPQTAARQA
jgi:hypothetical protein